MEIITSDIPDVLTRSARCGNRKVPIFLAPYGIGKSQQALLWAQNNNREYVDLRLAYYNFNDLRGYGVPNREKGVMEFLMSEDLPQDPDGSYLIHFEELTNCLPSTQKVAMQVMLDRRIGRYQLPTDSVVMASGNRLKDKTYAERFAAALADRLAFYHVRPDLDSFIDYMEANFKSDFVLAYIRGNPSAPYEFDIAKWDGESNFPTFRSIERLDDLVASYGSDAELANDRLLAAHAVACIGPKHGRMFAEFCKLEANVNVADLLADPNGCRLPDRPDIKWLVACRLISEANATNVGAVLTVAHRLNDDANTDNGLLMFESFVGNTLRRRKPQLITSPALRDWVIRHGDRLSRV